MKKLFMVAMAIVVAAGFVACTKEDVSAPTYKVEFTVGDKGGFDVNSRAVKTEWAAGDQILIITKPMSGGYNEVAIPNSDANCIRLIYNGSAWTVDRALTAEEIAARGEMGPWYAIHYRVKEDKKVGLGADAGGGDVRLANYYGGEVLECTGVFTITDGVVNLGAINMELSVYDSLVQVSVPGLDLVTNPDWKLTVLTGNYSSGNYTGFAHYCFSALWANEVFFRPSPGVGNYGYNKDTPYVVNGTDASFVFRWGDTDEGNEAIFGEYKFMLYNNNTLDAYVYTVDRGEYDDVNGKYEVNLECEKAYLLPTFDGDAEGETNWKPVSVI
ncbi:MAG: hypothetical protein IKJ02_02480 [Tidjanibacter sp.]|nr:hypothetical protein [Tidjanibacter sp.]